MLEMPADVVGAGMSVAMQQDDECRPGQKESAPNHSPGAEVAETECGEEKARNAGGRRPQAKFCQTGQPQIGKGDGGYVLRGEAQAGTAIELAGEERGDIRDLAAVDVFLAVLDESVYLVTEGAPSQAESQQGILQPDGQGGCRSSIVRRQ